MRVACAWQGATVTDLGLGWMIRWPRSGVPVLLGVTARPEQLPDLLAAAQGAQVVITPATPPGVERGLRRYGFRVCRISLVLECRPEWARPTLRPEIEVAEVTQADLDTWHRVFISAFGTPAGDPMADPLAARQAFAALADRSCWLLARNGHGPAGCGILYQEREIAFLLAVGTLPSARRRGVGTTLVSTAVSRALAGNAGLVFLETAREGIARRLYQRVGFRVAYQRRTLMVS